MTIYEFGDIVLVPFPFTDQSSTKKRPTVVVSSRQYNSVRADLVLIAVTSQINLPLLFSEVEITGWQSAGLVKASIIKPVITTLEKRLVIRQLGRLQDSDRGVLKEVLHGFLNE